MLIQRSARAIFSIRYSASWLDARPDLDFDFLLSDENVDRIRKNIQCRKGVGDIDIVRSVWQRIQNFKNEPDNSEAAYERIWDKFYDEALLIPNMSRCEAPVGGKPATVKIFGSVKRDDDALKTAEEIIRSWRSVIYPRASCGSRSYAFLGPAADLENALLSYVLSVLRNAGFSFVSVSDMVPEATTSACGLQQTSEQNIKYSLTEQKSLILSGTAEMGLNDLIKKKVFGYEDLPLKLTALSRCYRPEISKSAAEARLYRVHEFTKLEMFVVCKESESDLQLDELVKLQCNIFDSLGIHCRLLDMPTEELGAPAARKFDVEAWMPGRKLFGEVSSASNCTDYQSRRLGVRYVDNQGILKYVHTCNATALASTRAMIAVLETYQNDRHGLYKLPDILLEKMPKKRTRPLKFQRAPSVNGHG